MRAATESRAGLAVHAPMLWAALSLAVGIVVGRWCWRPALWWMVALLATLAGAAVLVRRARLPAFPLALGAMAALGALLWQGHADSAVLPDLEHFDGTTVALTGTVVRDPAPPLAGRRLDRSSFDVITESIQPTDRDRVATGPPAAIRAGVRVSVFSKGPWDADEEDAALAELDMRYGQRVRLAGRLYRPRNFGNPGAFDYREYLLERGVHAQMSTRLDRLEVLPGSGGNAVGALRSRLRRSLLAHIAALWPADDAALLDAMMVSERTLVERETRTAFQRTGIYHLLVVAGLHLGIFALFVYGLARLVRCPEWAATVVTLVAATGFAWINDDGTPVWRATLMLAVYLLARLLYRDRSPLNAIGTAALVLLALDPRALLGPSFQLSFAAVLAIAGIARPVIERTSAPWRRALRQLDSVDYDATLEPRLAQFRLDVRLLADRLARVLSTAANSPRRHGDTKKDEKPKKPQGFASLWLGRLRQRPSPRTICAALLTGALRFAFRLYEVVVISAAMQVCLALPMAWYFHRTITIGIPANSLAVPLAGILLPSAVTAVALGYISPWLARPATMLASATLHLVQGSAGALIALHDHDVRVATPTLAAVLVAAGAFVLAAWALRRRRAVAVLGLAGLVASAAWLALLPPRPQIVPGVLELTAIDVGQGDALLVVSPEGRTLLIDGGGQLGPRRSAFDFGEDVVAPYLWQRGITRLDAVALTHAHQDHIGGLASILEDFRPRQLWMGVNPPTEAVRALLARAAELHVAVALHVEGDEFDFGGTRVRVLAPEPGWHPRATAQNNDSLAMKITYGGTALLLPGDAEKKIEKMLAGEGVRADVLKVAHHGSATSTTAELLDAARPRFAVISVGARNSFGHPRPDVLARLAGSRVATYRTDTNGAVTFYLDGQRAWASLPALRPAPPR